MPDFVVGGRLLTPKEYGSIAVRSAQKVATGALESFRNPEYKESAAANGIICCSIPMYLQYIAVGISTYWFYAVAVLHAQTPVQKEMIEGLREALQDLSIEGELIPPEFRVDLLADVEAYIQAQIFDYDHPADPKIYNPDISAVAKLHIEKMGKYYGPFIETDRFTLGHLIADVSSGLIAYIHEELKLSLRQ